jgi:FkbM family methyltransferase
MVKRLIGKWLGPSHMDEVDVVRRVFGRFSGVVVDVGAHQGLALSPFLESGWVGYAIEPDPSNRAILQVRCPMATIDPRAISETDGQTVSLFTSNVSTGISTLSPFHASHEITASVETVRLDTFVQQHQIEQVDFLKIDIEGFDLFALRSFPWATHRPKAIVCEFEDRKTVQLGYDVVEMVRFIRDQGYEVVVSEWEPIVEYGQQHIWRRFTKFPDELPENAWGNLIGVEPGLVGELDRECLRAQRRLRLRHLVDRVRRRG